MNALVAPFGLFGSLLAFFFVLGAELGGAPGVPSLAFFFLSFFAASYP
jgi:hypothetical protein